jgi:hypothetical protein
VVREAQAEGYAKRTPEDIVAKRSWALAHGLASLWVQGNLGHSPGEPDLETLTHAVIDSYLKD